MKAIASGFLALAMLLGGMVIGGSAIAAKDMSPGYNPTSGQGQ